MQTATKEVQRNRVLRVLQTNGEVTNGEIVYGMHILRSSARIYDLRKLGHDIETVRGAKGLTTYIYHGGPQSHTITDMDRPGFVGWAKSLFSHAVH